MKKDLLNLINTDIDFIKLIFYRKIIFFYIVAIFFLSCDDNVVTPTWYTTINFPLTSTELLFSDMVAECDLSDSLTCTEDPSNQCNWNGYECNNEVFSLSSFAQ